MMAQPDANVAMTADEREELIMIITMRKNYAEGMLHKMTDAELRATYLDVMDYE